MRVLLAIGCNEYDHADRLNGAEVDAERIFTALTRPDIGEYDLDRSVLLRSPTFDEVRRAIAATLFSRTPVEVFTFYFAGHGSVGAGSFYMWVRDTSSHGLSVSGLSLGELFKNLNEAAPRQSNIIIDACESGGLVEDLGAVLKPALIGDAGSPAVTLFATSAKNEGAGETEEGGFGTIAILDCVEGREFVQDTSPALELIDIGRRVAARVTTEAGGQQSPVVWGLNLYGPPSFCKNPRFASDPALPLRSVMRTWSIDTDRLVRRHAGLLWKCYAEVGGAWNRDQFSALVRALLQPAAGEEAIAAHLAERLCATFLQGAAAAEDLFRRVEVAATIAVALLPISHTVEGAASAERVLESLYDELFFACAHLREDLVCDRYALLPRRGYSLAELFDLPLRVAKVMAWASMLSELAPQGRESEAARLCTEVVQQVLEHYAGSVVAISDEQAPCWAIMICKLHDLGLTDEGEQVAGLVFNSLVAHNGNIARNDLQAEAVIEFLRARAAGDFTDCYELLERPAETLTVLLKAAALYGLGEVFDPSLWKLDHTHLLAFVTDAYDSFGNPTIEKGQNLLWTIGHDIFRTGDLSAYWPSNSPGPPSDLAARLCMLASLLYPDRVPWFLFDGRSRACSLGLNLPSSEVPS